jgi:hypothetical protein
MRPFDGYPDSWGSKRASVFPHAGPANYTPLTFNAAGAVVTPGDTIYATEAGLKYFDLVHGGITDDGRFQIQIYRSALLSTSNSSLGPPMATVYARWIALVTGAAGGQAQVAGNEAVAGTNLSGFTVALEALGPK